MIRKIIHGEVEHHAGLTEDIEKERLWLHVNHCLLSLKDMVECKADVTPVVFQEAGNEYNSEAWTLKDAPRSCKNYQGLIDAFSLMPICSSGCNADEIYHTT